MYTSIHESWIETFYSGHGSVSLEIEPSVVVVGKSDIDIRCIVDGTNLKGIYAIQLQRSNKTVVTISRDGGIWKEAALKNKTGVTVNASISIVTSSYLHLDISKTMVRYPEDMGSYQCFLFAFDLNNRFQKDYSQILDLTGKLF